VVESGGILQRLLKRYLTGMEVVAVTDLPAARAELEHTPAQVVVINRPPGLSGLEDPDLFSALLDDTPAVLCSVADPIAYAPAPDIPEILVKPISQDDFLRALDKLNKPVESILLVEDEPDAQKLFVRMLSGSERGYKVVRAGNGAQALSILARQSFDVILLDLVMPEMDGYQFLKVREEDPKISKIPVILISAQDTRGHPIVSSFIAATRGGGISVQQLLDGIQALGAILSPHANEKGQKDGATASPPFI
jgi:CheY-like chemotaxis protein